KFLPQVPEDGGCQIMLVLRVERPIAARCESGGFQTVTGRGIRKNVDGVACELEFCKKQVGSVEHRLLPTSVQQCPCPHGGSSRHEPRFSGMLEFRRGEQGVDVGVPPAELVDDAAVVFLRLVDDASEPSGLLSWRVGKPDVVVHVLVQPGDAMLCTELA